MKLRDVFIRNKGSSVLLERFLIASVATVLVIRFYLAATGYPQIGGGGLHISHMLWGGLDMLVALVLSLAFLGRRIQSIVALLGGIGFGTFIDELGKFITSNNNYLFQPTLVLIYIIFIALLLSFRILENPAYVSEQERLANALSMLEKETMRKLREQDKKEIHMLLQASKAQEHADSGEHTPSAPTSQPGLFQRLVDSPQFAPTIIIFFIGYALLLLAFGAANLPGGNVTISIVKIGWLISSFLSYSIILIGMLCLRRSRLAAYSWFKRAMLVSIFLTQTFLVSMQPLAALDALLVNIIVLSVLNYLIRNCPQNSRRNNSFA